jgi:hypothetical protein
LTTIAINVKSVDPTPTIRLLQFVHCVILAVIDD